LEKNETEMNGVDDVLTSRTSPFMPKKVNGTRTPRRSRSLTFAEVADEQDDRIKYTRNYKIGKHKGNQRGTSIHGPFTTLEQVLKQVPVNVGFNIECKYPMIDECEEEEMDFLNVELNWWVNTVLKVVYDNMNGRNIIFSSFHPDICMMLALKQPNIPILFLTESGSTFMADIRASSLQQAIRFATRWNMLGIVSECSVFRCLRLVRLSLLKYS
jgi:glycerophosphodiester phosphodiesterase